MKKTHRQHQRAVHPPPFVAQVHEHGGDHRPLHRRDDERDRDRHRHGEVESRDRDRDDGEDHQHHEHRSCSCERSSELPPDPNACALHRAGLKSGATYSLARRSVVQVFRPAYNRYNTGNRKIHTRSTKCQYRPVYSIRFVNCSGLVFHIFAPGPEEIRHHDHPANDVQSVETGERVVNRQERAVRRPLAELRDAPRTRSTC